jgi:NADH:ubiquinone oxidoreductase subunit F (NADH-binding)
MKHTTRILTLAAFAAVSSAFGTPTGLNNIPTADTVGHRTVAVQYFSSFGGANQFGTSEAGKSGHWMGFKTGWDFQAVASRVGHGQPAWAPA